MDGKENFTPPLITVDGTLMRMEPAHDLDDETRSEYSQVFDMPEESYTIDFSTYAKPGKLIIDGPSLTLTKGWHGQFGTETDLIYFAFCYIDDTLYTTEMLGSNALEPREILNVPEGNDVYIYKLYCRVRDGRIEDTASYYNDGTYSEYCGPMRLFYAFSEKGSPIAGSVISKDSDFVNFLEEAKTRTSEDHSEASVLEMMKLYKI